MNTTNITAEHSKAFNALTSGSFDNFALFSCFLNGEPASAIVAISEDETSDYQITPLFVSVTPGMTLTDHYGDEASQ